ncbi:MAG TPA: hypothetical protein VJ919_02240 [Tangfeifania sp.]|nr:hypothetical protein [Tangfeifania sp.]
MKKLLFIVVMAAIYAIPASSATVKMENSIDSKITIVSDTDENVTTPEGEKEKDKKKKAVKKTTGCCPGKAAVKSGCNETQKKSCAASKVTCTETKKDKKEEKK